MKETSTNEIGLILEKTETLALSKNFDV